MGLRGVGGGEGVVGMELGKSHGRMDGLGERAKEYKGQETVSAPTCYGSGKHK